MMTMKLHFPAELYTPAQLRPPAQTLLRDLILEERDSHALHDAERQNLQRHLQKRTKAAQASIARGALQQEQIEFLHEINNEAKVRRITKSHVLGQAKVMSYEDPEAARAKRKKKEAGKTDKQKRGRKRKQKAGETCLSDASVQAAMMGTPELVGKSLTVFGTPFEDDVTLAGALPWASPSCADVVICSPHPTSHSRGRADCR